MLYPEVYALIRSMALGSFCYASCTHQGIFIKITDDTDILLRKRFDYGGLGPVWQNCNISCQFSWDYNVLCIK